MGWLVTIIVGFIVGVLAKLLHPGKDNLGFIMTTLLGIAGALVAGWVGQAIGWYEVGQPAGWIASTVFAVIILAVYTRVFKK
ncbi:MAG: GlsB/YeaQ/YmgE family stress response membrane protein [Neisseria sp.]|nr:GlsB/YeaQ/YmgE family stress response membrane protein [Neisseria sp.]